MTEFLSYGKQWIDDDDIRNVQATLTSDFLTQGPQIAEFEQALGKYTGARYCVAVANGTAALHLAVAALELAPDSEGITSTISFVASSNAMIYNNIKPVFADIDQRTYLLDHSDLEKRITPRTKLFLPVHFAGQPVEMKNLKILSEKYKCAVIEDAAHAIGSRYPDGSMVGNCRYSDLTIFSFHPVKTITTGEGGAITTNDPGLYQKLLLLRNHGITREPRQLTNHPGPWYYEMQVLGFNYRLTDLQAALGLSQLRKLDRFIQRRREIVQRYNAAFKSAPWLTTPYEQKEVFSAFHLYVLRIDFNNINKNRLQVMEILKKKNIGTQVHYIPIHTQPYYQRRYRYHWGEFPNAENYYQQALSIPLYPKLTDEQVQYVIDSILELGHAK
jgi:UDP-4-amino-4,6-dideoxy-N-acetyl-beta-L-altrosamine transaminase